MPASSRYDVSGVSAPLDAYAGMRNACRLKMSGGVPAASAALSSTMPGHTSEVVSTCTSGFSAFQALARICCTAQTSVVSPSSVTPSYWLVHSLKIRHRLMLEL